MMNEIEEILEENSRRLARIDSAAGPEGFDPVTGRGSIGPRFEVVGPNGERMWLPESMRDTEAGRKLLGGGKVTAAMLDTERVRHDFPYWAATRARIKRKGGGEDVLFRLNRAQRRLVEALEEMRVGNRPIRLILLKARQWGGSTH